MVNTTRTPRSTIEGLRPIFVVGHPRSGTTITQQLLSAHADIYSGRETLLFSHVMNTSVKDWELKTIPVQELDRIFAKLDGKSKVPVTEDARAELRALAERGELWPAYLLDTIMRGMKRPGLTAERWLEKSPLHLRYLPEIWRMFPDARVIHIVRDPRDVVSSQIELTGARYAAKPLLNALRFARQWDENLKIAHRTNDPRMITVRYDEIVTMPEQTVTLMSDHIGVPLDLSVIQRFTEEIEQVTFKVNSQEKEANRAVTIVDRRGMWRKRISTESARVVETICSETMRYYDYKTEFAPMPLLLLRARVWALGHSIRDYAGRTKATARGLLK